MATPTESPKTRPGLIATRRWQRKGSGMVQAGDVRSDTGAHFRGNCCGRYAFRSQKPVVEVATASKPKQGDVKHC